MKCVRCPEEAVAGRQKCSAHLAEAVRHNTVLSRKRIEANLCDHCGKRPPRENRRRCQECLTEQIESSKRYQAELLKRGLCPRCCHRPLVTKYRCSECGDLARAAGKRLREAARAEVFDHYGRDCRCCGESNQRFLTIDHVNNDGANHRRDLYGNRVGATIAIYRWLKRNGFPEGFQTLCMNCNFGKHMNGGICPHKQAVVA